ncbi:MAG: NAD-glutamate dehydrogenase [Proteobacteria bacterium]|nr:NAD-glutamate dehydrogenase [Pseudomonadota bacterium]
MKEANPLAIVQELTKFTDDKALLRVIDKMFQGMPDQDMGDLTPDWLFAGAQSGFDLLRRPKVGGGISWLRQKDDPAMAIIQIVHDEIPFLLDSLSHALEERNFDIQLVVHSIIKVKRDRNSAFLEFVEDEQPGNEESLIQFYVVKYCTDEQFEILRNELAEVLNCVELGVRDWLPVRAEMEKISEDLGDVSEADLDQKESKEFVDWLIAKNFIFLGYFETKRVGSKMQVSDKEMKGILHSKLYPMEEIEADSQYDEPGQVFIRKWGKRSVVHRPVHMDWLVIKKLDKSGKCIGAHNFLGLFTSSVYYQSVLTIPLIRIKTNNVVKRYGYSEASHNAKELVTALEAFPRGELLQMSEDELFETASGIVALGLAPKVRLFVRLDRAKKFVSCIIFIPRNRFSAKVKDGLESMLCEAFNGVISKQYVQMTESPLVRVQLLLQTVPHKIPHYDVHDLEEKIRHLINAWSEDLYYMLMRRFDKEEAKAKHQRFKEAFDVAYTATFAPKQAVHDIILIDKALHEKTVQFDIYVTPHAIGGRDTFQLKIYAPSAPLLLSLMLPKIENMGFKAFDVVNYEVKPNHGEHDKVYISHFRLFPSSNLDLDKEDLSQHIKTAFYQIWANRIEDDQFNSLIMYCGFDWRQSLLLRIYFRYLRQVHMPHDLVYVVNVLIKYQQITKQLVELFDARFNPERKRSEEELSTILNNINQIMNGVESIAEEQVIKAYISAIMATKRTNFFQGHAHGHKEYISLKVSSKEVLGMPDPKPYAETYVYAPNRFEGIHLRGAKVARGGLRWSDRPDFRTEVLGLMKAQVTKNSVIVPSGSKGGFFLKSVTMADGRDAFMAEGVECYKMFLRGILDITDNVVAGAIVQPKDVVRHDEDDPYLVVAADKGTATFSDYANSVSAEYDFWLGDAFASGGSAGYDHKKMAITARGAWISVEHHFSKLHVKSIAQDITAIGIGDMSGDVFGNGMLLSKHIRLLGAFNHMHIFLDPNPDAAKSYEERLRLFNLPRSQWSDYNPNLISAGGGVFNRSAKSLELSPQMAEVLGVKPGHCSPDELICELLKAPVDLLWNGGIGTYIKAEHELNEKIGDRTNDAIRVNGKELRCKIIGEGGNLGMTQLGRVEYARHGGRVNTDAIDNSAGVDCSDHEVNIKIALNQLMRSGVLTLEARNNLLANMTEEVAVLVLRDNHMQNRLISVEENGGATRISTHAWLIRCLEASGELDRALEFLPKHEDLMVLESEGKGLSRPEIAVLIAYAKNSAFRVLNKHRITNDPYLQKDLLGYFPIAMQNSYKDTLLAHQLSNEILSTVLVNEFINIMGCTSFHQLLDVGYAPDLIIKAYVVIRDLFNIKELWHEMEMIDGQVSFDERVRIIWDIERLLYRNIRWLLRYHSAKLRDINECLNIFQTEIGHFQKLYAGNVQAMERIGEQDEAFFLSLPDKLKGMLLRLSSMYHLLDIVQIAQRTEAPIEEVVGAYKMLSKKMHLDWVLMQTRKFGVIEYLDKMALQVMVSEIEDLHAQLTERLLSSLKNTEYCDLLDHGKLLEYSRFIVDMKVNSTAWIGALVIVVYRIREFLHN